MSGGNGSPPRTARAFAPASVSNVACGFDVLGFALDGRWRGRESEPPPGDIVEARASSVPGVRIEAVTGTPGVELLPLEASRNTAGGAALAVLAVLERLARADGSGGGRALGVTLRVTKHMPLRSGLGSSAASAAAAAVAVNELFGGRVALHDLLACALEGERIASGSLHADNVAPSLYGGFVLVRAVTPEVDVVPLPTPPALACAVVRPHLEVDTQEARRVLPDRVPLADAVRQWANVGALVAALHTGDLELLGRALEDRVAEPYRAAAVPGFSTAMRAARAAGALGGSLSGSGPSLFALARDEAVAARAAEAMTDALRGHGVDSDVLVAPVGASGGAYVLGDGEPW